MTSEEVPAKVRRKMKTIADLNKLLLPEAREGLGWDAKRRLRLRKS
jgi:hypothetical protein